MADGDISDYAAQSASGDLMPSAPAAAQALPSLKGYLGDVFSGRIAEKGLNALTAPYDPNQSFAANATNPAGIQNAADIAMGFSGGGLGIRAWHGSPYDFDRFDINRIRTGEGSNAYSQGLYFGEAKGTGQEYRDLTKDKVYATSTGTIRHADARQALTDAAQGTDTWEPVVGPHLHPDQAGMVAHLLLGGIDDSGSIDKFLRDYDLPEGEFAPAYQRAAELARQLKLRKNPGRLYEVMLHEHPEQFLDWEKSFPEQTPHVQKAIAGLVRGRPGANNLVWRAHSRSIPEIDFDDPQTFRSPEERDLSLKTAKTVGFGKIQPRWYHDLDELQGSGQSIYSELHGRGKLDSGEVSKTLRDAGIPGVSYWDKFSRAAKQGTRNYVMFDDRNIEILKKYGIGALIAGGGAALGSTGQGDGGG